MRRSIEFKNEPMDLLLLYLFGTSHLGENKIENKRNFHVRFTLPNNNKRAVALLYLLDLFVVPPESLNYGFNIRCFNHLRFGSYSKKAISIIVSLDFFTILHRNQGVILGGF